jgi:hypothetical protein
MQLRYTRAKRGVHSLAPVKLASRVRHQEGIKQASDTILVEKGWYVTGAVLDIIRIDVSGIRLREQQGIYFSISTSRDKSFQAVEPRHAIKNRRTR